MQVAASLGAPGLRTSATSAQLPALALHAQAGWQEVNHSTELLKY